MSQGLGADAPSQGRSRPRIALNASTSGRKRSVSSARRRPACRVHRSRCTASHPELPRWQPQARGELVEVFLRPGVELFADPHDELVGRIVRLPPLDHRGVATLRDVRLVPMREAHVARIREYPFLFTPATIGFRGDRVGERQRLGVLATLFPVREGPLDGIAQECDNDRTRCEIGRACRCERVIQVVRRRLRRNGRIAQAALDELAGHVRREV